MPTTNPLETLVADLAQSLESATTTVREVAAEQTAQYAELQASAQTAQRATHILPLGAGDTPRECITIRRIVARHRDDSFGDTSFRSFVFVRDYNKNHLGEGEFLVDAYIEANATDNCPPPNQKYTHPVWRYEYGTLWHMHYQNDKYVRIWTDGVHKKLSDPSSIGDDPNLTSVGKVDLY